MKKIFTIIWKDTILRFSSKSELLFFFILPVIFIVLLGPAAIRIMDQFNN